MKSLESVAKEVLELDEKATKGPLIIQRFDWESGEINYQIETDDIISRNLVFASVLDKKANADFIVHVRQSAPQFARAVLIMREALTHIARGKNGCADCETSWEVAVHDAYISEEALAQAENLMEDKK